MRTPIHCLMGRLEPGGESRSREAGCTRGGSRGNCAPVILGLAALLLWSAGVGRAQTLNTTMWVPNGGVSSVVRSGGTIYIGGGFSYVGPLTGGAVALDAGTGASQQPVPHVEGTVNSVSPGFTETDMFAEIPEKVQDQIKQRIPMGRFGKPEEIAKAALFLASDDASFITGACLPVDGGYTAQ